MKIKSTFIATLIPILMLLWAFNLHAATLRPNIFTDPTVNPLEDAENCSLRYAVESINNGSDFGGCSNESADGYGTNDTIILDVGIYALTIPGNSEDVNETGDLDIEGLDITVTGAGMDQTIIDASGIPDGDRVLDLNSVEFANINALRMTGGDVSTLNQSGGAIRAFTLNLNLNEVHLFENQSNRGGGLDVTCAPTITNSVIEGNQTLPLDFNEFGGGIALVFVDACDGEDVMTIDNSWIIGNIANGGAGGGIGLDNQMAMQVHRSTIDGNMASECGGGIYTDNNSLAAIGYSTISRNQALDSDGGGICDFSDYLFLTNSTVSTNTSEEDGGGIFSFGGLKGMYNVTVAFNQATGTDGFGGGVQRNGNDQDERFAIQVFNTIIAQNTAANRPDCEGNFGSGGYNLIGNNGEGDDGNCDFFDGVGDQVGTPGNVIDAQLGPLQANGGGTETHALALSSPAVDRGNDVTGCQSLDFDLFINSDMVQFNDLSDDQRSFTRPIAILDPNNPICDIGAFELQTFSFAVTKDDGLGGASVGVGDTFTYTISLTNSGPGDASGVTLSDPLPTLVSFVSLTTSQGSCSQAGGVVSCDLGDMSVGQAATITVTVTALTEGDAINTAVVTASGEDFIATVTTAITGGNVPGNVFVFGSGCGLHPGASGAASATWALLALLGASLWYRHRRSCR